MNPVSERTAYESYLELNRLLTCQNPKSGRHDEMLFVVIHQTTELWLKQILHEIKAAQRLIDGGEPEPALKALARVSRIQSLITQSWDALATLTPPDYLTFRDQLGTGSGFQSRQFRELEFILGLKDARHLSTFDDAPESRAQLQAALEAPSLYDSALRLLARSGVAVPAEALARDVREPYEASAGVEDAWLTVYRAPQAHWDLYELAEKLVDLEDAFRTWRFRHLTTVDRIIGRKTGTGGTAGFDYLQTGLAKRCFPELWSLRTRL